MVIIVAAVARNGVIGKDGKLPWHIPEDLAHFKDITLGKVVIMGRKTYESIGTALSNRINVVITRNLDYSAENCIVVHSFKDALELFSNEELFVIGGEEIFKEAILVADKMYITHINEDFEGDVASEFPGSVENIRFTGTSYVSTMHNHEQPCAIDITVTNSYGYLRRMLSLF